MAKIILSVLIITMMSCQPQSHRTIGADAPSQAQTLDCNRDINGACITSSTPVTSDNNNNDNQAGNRQESTDSNALFAGCPSLGTNSYIHNHPHIGPYNICNSNQVQSKLVAIQIQNVQNYQICMVPTTSENGNSTYIGQPRCFRDTTGGQVFNVDFVIDRHGFTTRPLTGVMIMQDRTYIYPAPYNRSLSTVDAYILCLDWLAQFQGSASAGIYCDTFRRVAVEAPFNYQNYIHHVL